MRVQSVAYRTTTQAGLVSGLRSTNNPEENTQNG